MEVDIQQHLTTLQEQYAERTVNVSPSEHPEQRHTTVKNPSPARCDLSTVTVSKSSPRGVPINYLLYLWVLFALATSATSISILKPKPGLYIEKMGECQVKRGILRFQIDFTSEELFRDSIQLGEVVLQFSNLLDMWRPDMISEYDHYLRIFHSILLKKQLVADRITGVQSIRNRAKRHVLGKLLTLVSREDYKVYEELDQLEKHHIQPKQNYMRLTTILERSQNMSMRYVDAVQSIA